MHPNSPFIFERVLLVDDNNINNILNKRLLELTHFSKEIEIRTNGLDAINYLQECATDIEKIPQIIFLDVFMPIMDGIGFLQEFPLLPKSILLKSRIVTLTSSLDANDYRRVMESPYVIQFVEKPLNKIKLVDTELKGIREKYLSIVSPHEIVS